MPQAKLVVDARGDACPVPVVKTLKALGELAGPGVVETMVDNKVAVENLTRMGEGKGCTVMVERLGERAWCVRVEAHGAVTVAAGEPEGAICEVPVEVGADDAALASGAVVAPRRVVVQVSSDKMGEGDAVLGAKLMKAFFFSLTQLAELPTTILLYNGGARLSCAASPVLEDLRGLADLGVEVLTCGTCLDHYGITDTLAVGEVTNMYVIAERLTGASLVVRP